MDTLEFRRALGHFATGVTIVSTRSDEGEAIGLTVSSFNSVSLTPPLILFSVARKALSLPKLMAATSYVVNILSKEQATLASSFGRPNGKSWADIPHDDGHGRSPLIRDSLVAFECTPHAQHDGGDHVIFIGKVLRCVHWESSSGSPLLFYQGGFHELERPSSTQGGTGERN